MASFEALEEIEELKMNEELDLSQDEESRKREKRKRKSIDVKTKLDVITMAKNVSIHSAATHFKIDRKSVKLYLKQEVELRELAGKRKRLDGGGRKLSSEEIDTSLANWIRERRAERKRVTRRIIFNQANLLFSEAGLPSKVDRKFSSSAQIFFEGSYDSMPEATEGV